MRYFVTGATGFIGKRLVRTLLAREGAVVYFLLREASRERLPALRAYWGVDDTRAIAVGGELLAPGLGIGPADMQALAGIDAMFHLAAIYDLAADPQAEMEANVHGTRNAVGFANTAGVARLHHMSSIAAAGLFEGIFREDMFEEAEHLDHPYFRSKHEAEAIVRNACNVPWRIYRPGLVVGDSATGATEKADGPYYFFKLIQRIRQLVPAWLPVPGIEGGRINIVPVDYVVAALDHIAHKEGLDGQAFHLTDPEGMRVGEVLDLFSRVAHGPPLSPRINFRSLGLLPAPARAALLSLAPVRRLRDALLKDLGLPPDITRFINFPTRFDCREAQAALRGSGIACPPLERYAPAIWDYWERHLDPELGLDRTLRGNVKGKVVLVTGGSSGIGLASALMLAEAGATTLVCGRDGDKLAHAQAEAATRGVALHAYRADLADMADTDRFAQQVLGEHGKVDILVNCAGRSIRRPVEASLERFHDFERTMQLNYFGALRIITRLLPSMLEHGSGHIINISSIGVLTGAPRFSGYLASKAALDAWSRSAAAELADQGISFTTINMPLVRTPMIAPTHMYRNVPALTPQQAADMVAQAIVYKPVRVATRTGLFGQLLQAVSPRSAQLVLNTTYRMFPDTPPVQPPAPMTAEQSAVQQLLRGIHL